MGEIIDVARGDEPLPAPLTQMTKEGFRTGEYLADRPAIAAVEEDERVAFVLTNHKQGLAIRDGTTRHAIPDDRYQTVVVVTDRRVIALVGQLSGDEQFTLDISELTDVTTTKDGQTGKLVLERTDGSTWVVPTGAEGLTEVAEFLGRRGDMPRAAGRPGTVTESIRGLFESTVGSAKSFEGDQVAELLPALGRPSSDRAAGADATGGTSDQASTVAASSTGATETDSPDRETAIDDILAALAKTDWRARGAQPESPFDLLAERSDELVGVVVHCPSDGQIDHSSIRRCDAITGAAGTDTVMLATTATIRHTDARLAADLGVRLRNVETLRDDADPPTIEAVSEMVTDVLQKAGWSVRQQVAGPFDLLADSEDELMGVVVHRPEDGTVRSSIEHCDAVTGAAGTDIVMLATTGTVRDTDERLAEELGVRLVKSDSLAQRHVTEIDRP